MSAFLYSWNPSSEGAAQLAKAISIQRIRHNGSTFKGSPSRTVINWGSRKCPEEVLKCKVLNPPNLIERAANKLSFFQLMDQPDGPRIPPYGTTTDWCVDQLSNKHTICIRATVNGHSGAGLSIISPRHIDLLTKAPLYTIYVPKQDEYRIHFVNDKIIDIQRKALKKTDDAGEPINPKEVNFKIRNLANGFVFIRNDLKTPDDVLDQATKAYILTELDFGAIDVIWSEKEKKAYVLEINTAPGLCHTTVTNYANAFKEFIQ